MSLPTLRTLGGHVLWIVCNSCQHAIEADQPALIAAGRGDVPVVEPRLRHRAALVHPATILYPRKGLVTAAPALPWCAVALSRNEQ